MIRPKIGCYAIFELSEEDWEKAPLQLDTLCRGLEVQGMEVVKAAVPVTDEASSKRVAEYFAAEKVDLTCPLIITWCHDHNLWTIQKSTRVPVAVWAIPGLRNGSALGAQQVGCFLGDLDIEHRLYYGSEDDAQSHKALAVYAKACAVRNKLRNVKIAMVGRRTPGMTPTAFDEVEIMRVFGCQVVTYGMDEVAHLANTFDDGLAGGEWEKLSKAAASVLNVAEGHGILTMKYYLALKKIARDNNFAAMAVGCYPSYCGTTCIPVALLNEEGIAAGCEGDLNSTIAMYILTQLTGKPVHFGEMCVIDRNENYILSSHCGAAPVSMACEDGYTLCPVRLANTGVCIRYRSKPGRVTYMNLVGRKDKYRICAFEGNAVDTPLIYEGNPMKIVPRTPVSEIWDIISEYSFGHHWMAVYDQVEEEIKELCRLLEISGIFPDLKKYRE